MKQLEAYNWSTTFREVWSNKDRILDFEKYELCLNEWQSVHEKKMIKNYVITILLFCAGLLALYEHAIFMAVLLLALAANSNQQSSAHILISEIMNTQRLLAMLINRQSQSMEDIRKEIREGKDSKTS